MSKPLPRGAEIRLWRQRRGKTVIQLASEVGISKQHLYNLELGYNTARPEILYRIATALSVEFEAIAEEAVA